MLSWINKKVAIGEYGDAINKELLKQERIDCVLNLRGGIDESSIEEQHTLEMFLGIKYFHLKVGSHQGLNEIKIELRTSAYMLDLISRRYKRILVHCTAGRDRAPFVVAWWLASQECSLMLYDRKTCRKCIIDAYKLIKKRRPQILEHWEWI